MMPRRSGVLRDLPEERRRHRGERASRIASGGVEIMSIAGGCDAERMSALREHVDRFSACVVGRFEERIN